jgi:hypothetical protein
MGQVDMARLNPALLLKYSETATLDPYAVSGAVSMALFEELVATASIVGQPDRARAGRTVVARRLSGPAPSASVSMPPTLGYAY